MDVVDDVARACWWVLMVGGLWVVGSRYGESYEDMQELHELLPTLLRPGGVYSFFNGFCPFSPIFHEVTEVRTHDRRSKIE